MDKLTFKEWSILADLETIAPLGEDFEFSMARGELKTAKSAINRLMRHLNGEGDLEAWVQSKITKAAEYLDTVADHMDGGEDDTKRTKEVKEDWSKKYKNSIDCDNPKGFSQKAHCQGRKKKVNENMEILDADGNLFATIVDIIKGSDYKFKSFTQPIEEKCWTGYKKKGMKTMFGKRYPNCVKKEEVEIEEDNKSGDSSLRDWFTKSRSSDGTPGWVQLGGKYAGKPCAKQPGQTTKPKCGSSKMKADLSDKEEDSAFRRKNQEDPNPDRRGKAKMVATEEKDACYSKVKSRYRVWPSAYASGALVKCRKVGAANWGNKTKKEEFELQEMGEVQRYCPKCKKNETMKECRYGEGYWKMFSMPASLAPDPYDPNDIHPANESIIYPGQITNEDYQRIQSTGNVYTILFSWRGRSMMNLQLFFPSMKRPSKDEVQKEIEKFYPGAIIMQWYPSPSDPSKPIVVIQSK